MVAALAVDTRKGIASQEEVRNRAEKTPDVDLTTGEIRDWLAEAKRSKTSEQLREVWRQANRAKAPKDVLDKITAQADELDVA
jgi:hypothetical protein